MKVGLIVNPIAGMGGRVGLKGTDGEDVLKKAIDRGAVPEAPRKVEIALRQLTPLKNEVEIITVSGDMGENQAKNVGFSPKVLESSNLEANKKDWAGISEVTTIQDTIKGAQEMISHEVDLLLFGGGDGTARNIYDAVGSQVPVIGIPAGVKIHSAVFGTTPTNAGELAREYLENPTILVREREVMDIDEKAFREGQVSATLHGYLNVPEREGLVQSLKSASGPSEGVSTTHIADYVITQMTKNTYYIIGPGTTTRRIMERLDLPHALLGVDVVCNKKLILKDAREQDILDIISKENTDNHNVSETDVKIIVTVIGGQGYIFGRGNQQLSPDVLKKVGKKNITVIAPQEKLASLGGTPLLIDTGEPKINKVFSGYYRVVVSYKREIMYPAKG